jgi:hypothetical protein
VGFDEVKYLSEGRRYLAIVSVFLSLEEKIVYTLGSCPVRVAFLMKLSCICREAETRQICIYVL